MRQIKVQLDNVVAEQLEETASKSGYTLAGYISTVISGYCTCMLKEELDAKRVLLDLLATSEPDSSFIRPEDIPWETTTPREAFS